MNPEKPKSKRGKKAKTVTPAQRKARRENVLAFRQSVGGKTNLQHGVHTVIKSAGQELPPVPYAAEIREHVSALIDAAIADLGGETAITSMQKQILESSRLALTIVALGARYLASEGVVNRKNGKPHALLSVLGTYANIVRLNAAELGLQRQPRNAGSTLDSKMAEIAKREHDAATDEAETKN